MIEERRRLFGRLVVGLVVVGDFAACGLIRGVDPRAVAVLAAVGLVGVVWFACRG